MRKQVYSNGKDRNLDLGFEVPYNNDLKISLADGSSVPFVMYKRNAVRFTKDIPEGDVFLDIEESMPTVKPVKLDNIGLSLIRQKDIDRLNRFSQELGIKEEIIRRKEIDINALAETIKALETQNSQKIDENLVSVQQSLQELYGVINGLDEQGKARDVSLNDLVVSLNNAIQNALQTHVEDFNNPHNVKKEQIGLGNVDNTADIDKPISKAVKKALDEKLDKTEAESIREEIKKSQKTVEKIHTGLANMTGGIAQLELPRGGKEDQLLAKASNKDGHFKWIDSPIIKHNDTSNRDDADCHPISAITGLQDELDLKLPTSTKYGSSLSLTIDNTTFIMTAQLKDQDGNNLGTAQTIDLPMESVVVSGYYDSDTKEVVLTLQSGSTIRFSVADLVAGLQSEITASNKLDADLVDDSTSTNKFVTASDKTTWNGKQDAISDLATIRSGASAGATALQPNASITGATKCKITYDSKGLVTAGADLSSSDITTALGYTPYNSTNPSGYQANVLEGVQVNGTDLTISSKKVNVPVPTTVAELTDSSNYVLSSSLATVATSGLYSDLTGTPTIPTVNNAKLTIQKNGTSVGTFTANASSNKTVNITVPTDTGDLTNGAGFITGISSGDVTTALGFTPADASSLATVATSGQYSDLTGTPTIPTVNNPTIKITQGGVEKGSFTLNQSTGDTIALDAGGGGSVTDVKVNGSSVVSGGVASITVPTDTGDLTNGAGFITISALSGYATQTWVGQQGYLTSISSSDVTTALGYTPYNSSNPNGYTSNVGTVTSVNNTSPDGNGNVSLTIPDISNLANKDLSNLSTTGQDIIDGKVSKSGDTMTGALNISNANQNKFNIVESDVTKGTAPASDKYTTIQFNDSSNSSTWQNTRLGAIEHKLGADGSSRMIILAAQNVAASNEQALIWVEESQAGIDSCGFPNTKCVDGQWVVASSTTIASGVSGDSSYSNEFDLSSFLPNDGQAYDCLFYASGRTGTTSGNTIRIYLTTSLITGGVLVVFGNTRTSSSGYAGGACIIPVGTNRKVTMSLDYTGGTATNIELRLAGYRRIGTNS